MTLAALIRHGVKSGARRVATATSATDATDKGVRGDSVARVATVAVANSTDPKTERGRHWRIRRTDGELLDVIFGDIVALADVRAVYPDALERVRQDDEPGRRATPAEADELRALVAVILADDIEDGRGEALALALVDPEAALTSFRALAGDIRTHAPARGADDDRRRCTDCANLTAREHRCLAAWRGERPGNAPRDYHPIIDLPRRCECYAPKASDADQRTGAERWPFLIADTQRLRQRGTA